MNFRLVPKQVTCIDNTNAYASHFKANYVKWIKARATDKNIPRVYF